MAGTFRDGICRLSSGALFDDRVFPLMLGVGYILSFGLMFLIPARFWDDLQIFNNPDIVGMSRRSGILPGGIFLHGMMSLPHPDLMMRLFAFFIFLLIIVLVRDFLRRLELVGQHDGNAIALLSAVLPLFLSRFQLITCYYCLALFLFCAGASLLSHTLISSRPLIRAFAYFLLILSFYIQSLLTLYWFVLLLLAIRIPVPPKRWHQQFTAKALALLRRMPEAFALPFAFFLLKSWLTPPTSDFAGYNAVTLAGLWNAALYVPFKTVEALLVIPGDAPIPLLALAPLLLLLLIFPSKGKPITTHSDACTAAVALLIGLIGAAMAVFPYIVVSRSVGPYDFDDRNQLTLMLVAGGVIVFFVRTFFRPHLQWVVLALLFCWCILYDTFTYFTIIRDGHDQNAIVRAIAHNSSVGRKTSLLVDTRNWPGLSRHRTLSTAQLNCLIKDAFGDETHFAANLSNLPFDWQAEQAFMNRYRNVGTCFRAWIGGAPALLTVTASNPLDLRALLKLSALYFVSPERYNQALDALSPAKVSLTSVPSGWLKKSD
jgi:hypothetical protein